MAGGTVLVILAVTAIINLSNKLAVMESNERDIKALKKDHTEAIKNAKTDCDERVKRAVAREKRRQNVENDVNNPNSGIIDLSIGMHR